MHEINIQNNALKTFSPNKTQLRNWANSVLTRKTTPQEVTIRIVDVNEMTQLNSTYRKKNSHTNVLSFPIQLPHGVTLPKTPLGDIVICAEVVNREADEQSKTKDAHWAHMIVHGIYHLLGYDHETEKEAHEMEALEIETLKQLGFTDPYERR